MRIFLVYISIYWLTVALINIKSDADRCSSMHNLSQKNRPAPGTVGLVE